MEHAQAKVELIEADSNNLNMESLMPGKKDDVSFVVTRIDEERNVAVGLISRIIRQNIILRKIESQDF